MTQLLYLGAVVALISSEVVAVQFFCRLHVRRLAKRTDGKLALVTEEHATICGPLHVLRIEGTKIEIPRHCGRFEGTGGTYRITATGAHIPLLALQGNVPALVEQALTFTRVTGPTAQTDGKEVLMNEAVERRLGLPTT